MRYQVAKVGEPGNLYIEEEDIIDVQPAKDGRHAAAVTVRYRNEYRAEAAFRGTSGSELTLLLNVRQLLEILEQDRADQTGFCSGNAGEGCYDHGKTEEPPTTKSGPFGLGPSSKDCARCHLLHACRNSGQGDYRKQIPPQQYGPTWVMSACMILLVVLWWWTLCQWSGAASRAQVLRRDLAASQIRLKSIEAKLPHRPAPTRKSAIPAVRKRSSKQKTAHSVSHPRLNIRSPDYM